jgi:hypothetical protein
MITGEPPFGDLGGVNQINGSPVPDFAGNYSADLKKILDLCLAKNTWERPKASDIVRWMRNYTENGDYGLPKPTVSNETVKQEGNNTGGNNASFNRTEPMGGGGAKPPVNPVKNKQSTVGDGGFYNTDIDAKKRKTRTVWIVVLILAVVAAVIIYAATRPGSSGNDYPGLKPLDTTKMADTSGTSHKPAVDSSKKDSSAGHNVNPNGPKQTPPSTTPITSSAVTTMEPSVDLPPRNENISIRKIERTGSELKVYFTLRKNSGENYTFTIYGPDSPSNCFFVFADGTNYSLINISPKGDGLSFGSSNTFHFVATFQAIPSSVHEIDIIEGTDRDRTDQNFWTFKGVHVN